MDHFELISEYKPSGDQPEAIEALANGVNWGLREQTLLGVTGSGKTFTMASVIAKLNRPTLVLAHNKTLAAQLCSEFREFFPKNVVEYFISYYDYYQPEAYIAHTDTYIEKDASVNEEIDRLRHSATSSLFERRDVIIVASVSCLYGLGDPIDYKSMVISLRVGQERPVDEILKKLTEIRYERNDVDFSRNKFRVRGDTLEVYPAYWSGRAIRVEFFGDEIDRISEINAVSGMVERYVDHVAIYPASHYVASREKLQRAMLEIQKECDEQVVKFRAENKLIEAQRIAQRTAYDLEMMTEIGFCNGIENYSRVIQGRAPGSPPTTLLDYFPKDFLMFIDESHVTLPQCRAMYAGDRSRKDALVNYGFRLPSAYDNRPLNFKEFDEKINQVIEQALEDAHMTLDDMDAIGVTYGPGLVGALLVGVAEAKAIAYAKNLPLVGVHHIEGHISANYIENKDLEPPFLCLVVSGGHTHLVKVTDYGKYEILGKTRDDAAGEAFDKVARAIGLGYPGGPKVDKLSKEGNPNAIEFPKAKIGDCPYDFSFSGVKSAVLNYINHAQMTGEEINRADLAASFQKAVVDVLVEHSMWAVDEYGFDKFAIAGGVASNSALRMAMEGACRKKGIKFYHPSPIFCTDNAAMIGVAGKICLPRLQ